MTGRFGHVARLRREGYHLIAKVGFIEIYEHPPSMAGFRSVYMLRDPGDREIGEEPAEITLIAGDLKRLRDFLVALPLGAADYGSGETDWTKISF